MIITDTILNILAPFECISCGDEGVIMCNRCKFEKILPSPSQCYKCHKITKDYSTCNSCKRFKGPKHVWVTTEYDGLAKDLIRKYKFLRAKSASNLIAELIIESLPLINSDMVITYLPTASSRVRQRGYDQSKVLAKELAAKTGLPFLPTLSRLGQTRQVSSKRGDRLAQTENSYRVINESLITNSKILLVDDIITTGSSIESATKILKKYRAHTVDAVVFARAL